MCVNAYPRGRSHRAKMQPNRLALTLWFLRRSRLLGAAVSALAVAAVLRWNGASDAIREVVGERLVHWTIWFGAASLVGACGASLAQSLCMRYELGAGWLEVRSGVFHQRSQRTSLAYLLAVSVDQGVLARLMNWGDLILEVPGGFRRILCVSRPTAVADALLAQGYVGRGVLPPGTIGGGV